MTDVEIAAGVLGPWVGAVLGEQSPTIQGTVVQAVGVRVAGNERQPVREPLRQGRLQAVVVGMGIVGSPVDEAQPGEFREWRRC